jgi:hypothetical protein
MAGYRFSLALLAVLMFVHAGWSQVTSPPVRHTGSVSSSTKMPPAHGAINKVYSLADLGDDPNLCKWIAETIPQMIKPNSWNGQNLCYYAPAKVMAIHQTLEVHAQVEEFLANLRKTASRTKQDPQVTRAQYVPDVMRPVGPASASQAYPVPTTLPAPKHLFHFIIRYEGAGIIDSNVTKFTDVLTKATGMSNNQARWDGPLPSMPVPPPPPGALAPSSYHSGVMMMPAVSTQGTRMMPPADPVVETAPPEPLPIVTFPASRPR